MFLNACNKSKLDEQRRNMRCKVQTSLFQYTCRYVSTETEKLKSLKKHLKEHRRPWTLIEGHLISQT